MGGRRMVKYVTVAATAAVGFATGILPASASAASPRFVSPTEGSVHGGTSVRVVVRDAGGSFRAHVAGRDVTRRFGKATRGGVRSAVLRRGRDLRAGTNRIVIEHGRGARRRYVARKLVVASRAKLMRLQRVRGRARRAPLHFRLRSSAPIGSLRVALNGRRIAQSRLAYGARSHVLLLGADEGLRFGANRLAVTLVGTHGKRFDRTLTTIRVPRSGPLPGAGRDHRLPIMRRVRLDAGSTLRAQRGSTLRYRWRLVQAPRGSRARLRDAGAKRPALVPDKPGVYRVRLTATERPRRGGGTRARTAGIVQSSGATTNDEMTIEATPAVGPIGQTLQTISGGGIALGGDVLTVRSSWVQMVVLDRGTLEVVENVAFNPMSPESVTALDAELLYGAVAGTSSNDLVVLSGGGRAMTYQSTDALVQLATVFEALGVDTGTYWSDAGQAAIQRGQWSAVGVADSSAGSGHASFGLVTGGGNSGLPAGQPGGLQGYLQENDNDQYAFVSADHAPIDTYADGASATVGSVSVAGSTYTTSPIPNGAAGFQLLTFDAQLRNLSNQLFVTNNPDGSSGDTGGLSQALWNIQNNAPAGTLVILQSIGSPSGVDPYWIYDVGIPGYDWTNLDNTIDGVPVPNDQNAWGNPQQGYSIAGAIGMLAGPSAHDQIAQMVATQPLTQPAYKGGYTLIASVGDPQNATSVSQVGSGNAQPGVSGALMRTSDSTWSVANPTSVDGFDQSLLDVVYQDTVSWPLTGTAAQQAALQWFARALDLYDQSSGVTTVRDAYAVDDEDDWSNLGTQLAAIAYPGDGNGFSRSDFNAVKAQLAREFPMVENVQTLIGDWQSIFTTSTVSGYIDLQSIANGIEDAIDQEIADQRGTLDTANVIAHSLGIAGGLFGVAGLGPIGGGLGALSSTILLTEDLSQDRGGSLSVLPVVDAAANLGQDLADRYAAMQANVATIGDILVSDWGKLQAASGYAVGRWAVGSKVREALTSALTVSTQREAYRAMLPLAFGQYLLAPIPTGYNSDPASGPWNYTCEDDSFITGGTKPLSGTQANPNAWINFAYAVGGDRGSGFTTLAQNRVLSTKGTLQIDGGGSTNVVQVVHEPEPLSASLSPAPFTSLTQNGLGMDQAELFGDPAFTRWPLYCDKG